MIIENDVLITEWLDSDGVVITRRYPLEEITLRSEPRNQRDFIIKETGVTIDADSKLGWTFEVAISEKALNDNGVQTRYTFKDFLDWVEMVKADYELHGIIEKTDYPIVGELISQDNTGEYILMPYDKEGKPNTENEVRAVYDYIVNWKSK